VTEPFCYLDGELCAESVPLRRIAEKVGTPTFVYSHSALEQRFRAFDGAFGDRAHLICYSVKANSNLAVLRALAGWGAGADIVSAGELYRALRAGMAPERIVFSGVGKREDEIEYALESGILAFHVESRMELEVIERVAARLGRRAPVSLRVNPDIDAETHPYISTGLKENKFGIPLGEAREVYRWAAGRPHIEVVGIACHIGSQLTKVAPFRDAVGCVVELVRELAGEGLRLRYLDVGGGLGIRYRDERPPSVAEYGAAIGEIVERCGGLGLTLLCEPGRAIVGAAGVLLTRVLYLKPGEGKNFVVVDAAFNDLIRPAFYEAFHEIRPVVEEAREPLVADVVGPICETGDFLARERELGRPRAGELLAVMSAGAYGFTMSSNYNSRPRAAEVMVRGDRFAVVRRREELEDLVRGEEMPDWPG
jgi:diaminopimelate decarboxylase